MTSPAAAAAQAVLFCLLSLAAPLNGSLFAASRPRWPAPLVDVRSVDSSIVIDLSYNRSNNTFKKRLYRSNVALLRRPVAQRLARVQKRLRPKRLRLKIWDAYRPSSVQWTMWRIRPNPRYLARPWRGSRHSRGAAVDVTLVDSAGQELPMPTPHDEFSRRAHRGAASGVTPARRRNAALLDQLMRLEGFRPNRYEWWHYEAPDAYSYPLSNQPLPPQVERRSCSPAACRNVLRLAMN